MQNDAPNHELARLYPSLSSAELKQAEENLDAYFRIAMRIWNRLETDSEAHARFEEVLAASRNGQPRNHSNGKL
jgi:hypothetical protein